MEAERLFSTTGPTEGRLIKKNRVPPRRIAMIHCAGSRTPACKPYCSAVCCRYLLKFVDLALNKLPDVFISVFFSDWCLPGKDAWKSMTRIREHERVRFCRMAAPNSLYLSAKDDDIGIHWEDGLQKTRTETCDMVILAPPMTGAESAASLS
jgi:heterodisulfide reductase subunit A